MTKNFLAGALAGIKLASNVGAAALLAAAAVLAACTNPTSNDNTDAVNAAERAKRQNEVRAVLVVFNETGFESVQKMYDAIIAAVVHNTDVQKTIDDAKIALQPVLDKAKEDKADEDLRTLKENAANWVNSASTTFYYLSPPLYDWEVPYVFEGPYSKLESQKAPITVAIAALTLGSDVDSAVLSAFRSALSEGARPSATITPTFSDYMAAQTRGRATRAQNRVAKASYDAARAPMFAELASARARTGVQL